MKKLFAILVFLGVLVCGAKATYAQDSTSTAQPEAQVAAADTSDATAPEEQTFHQAGIAGAQYRGLASAVRVPAQKNFSRYQLLHFKNCVSESCLVERGGTHGRP